MNFCSLDKKKNPPRLIMLNVRKMAGIWGKSVGDVIPCLVSTRCILASALGTERLPSQLVGEHISVDGTKHITVVSRLERFSFRSTMVW